MATGPWIQPQRAYANNVNGTNLLASNPANYLCHLVTSGWTPNDTTDELWAAASANELPTGNGYTLGGIALTGVTLTHSGVNVVFTCNDIVWNATGSGISGWRRAVIRYNGTLNGKLNPIVAHALGDSTDVDAPSTTAGLALRLRPHATDGIVKIVRV